MTHASTNLYIIHLGTGQVIRADETFLIRTNFPEELAEGIKDGTIDAERSGRRFPDPYLTLSFEPDAIREYYGSYDAGEPGPAANAVHQMTDDELADIGDRALSDDSIEQAFGEALEAAVDEALQDRWAETYR